MITLHLLLVNDGPCVILRVSFTIIWSSTWLCAGTSAFYLYTTPLSVIISSFDINHHLYADDTQIYMSLSVSSATVSLEKLQHCLLGLPAWMTRSKLKLNLLIPARQNFFLLGPNFSERKFLHNFPCLILGQYTNSSASAKNLGVLFDSGLNF